MAYNVFGGTLNLTQSIKPSEGEIAIITFQPCSWLLVAGLLAD